MIVINIRIMKVISDLDADSFYVSFSLEIILTNVRNIRGNFEAKIMS